MSTLRITNLTRNSVLATHANVALDPATRRRGLLGLERDDFTGGSGLFIPLCSAIHTVEMEFAIDVLFLEMHSHRVIKTVECAMPGCHFNTIRIPSELCGVLELPEGTLKLSGTVVADVLIMMVSGHATPEELKRVGAL